ncbi:MAG: hypothetical protein R6U96_16080 [Promethearchaeia archaeon]
MNLGKTITEAEGTVEEKRKLFKRAFEISNFQEPLEAIINMWAVGTMLEDDLSVNRKVRAVREILENSKITNEMLETWTKTIYTVKRAPKDVLDLIAINIRNREGISKEIKKMLGHPNP